MPTAIASTTPARTILFAIIRMAAIAAPLLKAASPQTAQEPPVCFRRPAGPLRALIPAVQRINADARKRTFRFTQDRKAVSTRKQEFEPVSVIGRPDWQAQSLRYGSTGIRIIACWTLWERRQRRYVG